MPLRGVPCILPKWHFVGRQALPHQPPLWAGTSKAIFFVTICCQERGQNQLCHPAVARLLCDAAKFYHDQEHWHLPLLLLMPDHVHPLASFGPEPGMMPVVGAWKKYTSRYAGIHWQRSFFDHRLRTEESFDEKAAYIRQNPVRAGLIAKAEDWPHLLELR